MKKSQKKKMQNGTQVTLVIERRRSAKEEPYWQTYRYTVRSETDTVATALTAIVEGHAMAEEENAEPLRWECSCLQKKCGACAMRINAEPALACDRPLRDLPEKILLEPLRKFPRVADLQIDRSVMQNNLKEIEAWMHDSAGTGERRSEDAYAASRCLQCGLCLEVCPNFDPKGGFTGAAGAVWISRLLTMSQRPEASELTGRYKKRVFDGCGKSLACRGICPAGIDIGEMLAQSNALAVWKRKLYNRAKRKKGTNP